MEKLNKTFAHGQILKTQEMQAIVDKIDEIIDNGVSGGGGSGGEGGSSKKEVKLALSDYIALRNQGKVDSNTRYYIINIDCDMEALDI